MLKEALQYLVSLKDNKTYTINGETWSDHELHRVPVYVDRPEEITVNGLDSIVKLVRNELDMMENRPVYIRVVSPREVEVFSTLDSVMGRDFLYRAKCDTDYLLDLLSRISKDDGVTTEDNGVSQTVSARQGVSLKRFETVKPRITLIPYRTFLEVLQPSSEFILRLDENCRVGLLEADGGQWKTASGKVVVMA